MRSRASTDSSIPSWGDARNALERLSQPELRCLRALAKLPLITAPALATLLAWDARSCRERIALLVEAGLADSMRVARRKRTAPGSYYPTDLGIAVASLVEGEEPRHLAARGGVHREALLVALPRLAALDVLYGMLGALAASRTGAVELLAFARPWSARYHRRTAKAPVYARWDAYAELAWAAPEPHIASRRDREAAPNEVEWGEYLLLSDTGAAPLSSYRSRVRSLHEYRIALGGQLPQVVITTTVAGRADAWSELLDEEARRTHTAPLGALVLSKEELALGNVPYLQPGERTGSRLHRQPPTGVTAPLDPESTTDPVPVLVGGRIHSNARGLPAAGRSCTGAPDAFAADPDLLQIVARHPFLDGSQLAVVTGRSGLAVLAACHRLERRDLLRRLRQGEAQELRAGPPLWECSRSGLELSAAASGLPLRTAVEALGYYGGGPSEPVGSRTHLLRFPDHTRGADGFFVQLYAAVAEYAGRGVYFEVEEWRNAAACAWGGMRPDGYGLVRCREEQYGFYLEWDRGITGRDQLVRKFRAYLELKVSERLNRDFDAFPTILVACEDATVERAVEDAVFALGRDWKLLSFRLTTRDLLEADPDRSLGDVWRDPGETVRKYWFLGRHAVWRVRTARTLRRR